MGDLRLRVVVEVSPRSAAAGSPQQAAVLAGSLRDRVGPIRDTTPSSARTGGRCNFIENCRQHEGGTREQ
jgi:hypothetical protein